MAMSDALKVLKLAQAFIRLQFDKLQNIYLGIALNYFSMHANNKSVRFVLWVLCPNSVNKGD